MEKVEVEKLPVHVFELLSSHLRTKFAAGKDWRSLAAQLRFTFQEENCLHQEKDPVQALLNKWIIRDSSATISELLHHLRQLQRYDTVEDVQKLIGMISN